MDPGSDDARQRALDALEEGAMAGADLGLVFSITGARQIPTLWNVALAPPKPLANEMIVRPTEQEV